MSKLDVPIFDSISHFVRRELELRHVHISGYKRWEEPVIRAAGFEVTVDIAQFSETVQEMVINWDWDIFREALLARQLEGMSLHPLRKDTSLVKFDLEPSIDIEISWHLSPKLLGHFNKASIAQNSIDHARNWMDVVNNELKTILKGHDLINRWHVELEGSASGRIVSTMSLITYLQYSFVDLTQLEQIQRYISRKLQSLLVLNTKILRAINLADREAA
jgi:hypothetical protein